MRIWLGEIDISYFFHSVSLLWLAPLPPHTSEERSVFMCVCVCWSSNGGRKSGGFGSSRRGEVTRAARWCLGKVSKLNANEPALLVIIWTKSLFDGNSNDVLGCQGRPLISFHAFINATVYFSSISFGVWLIFFS